MYVSITGLEVSGPLQVPLFWRHAIPTTMQARKAKGNLFTDVRRVGRVMHTLTVWQDRSAMRAFMGTGAHLAAMKAMSRIGSGRTCGYESDHRPSWDEALKYWSENARDY